MSALHHYGLFAREQDLLAAVRLCRRRGLRPVDAFLPHPVHGLDALLDQPRSRLPRVTLLAGAAGLGLALWFQYWASSASWPLDVGGKPFDSLPAFVPVAFEMLVLAAGLGTVAAFVLRSRLRPGEPRRALPPRVTDDRFVLLVEQSDAALEEGEVERLWRSVGALESWTELAP